MEAVFSWVKNIIVFFLILTLIDELIPAASYKKYVKVAAGMVLILIVFSPILGALNMDSSMDYYYQWESLKTSVMGSELFADDSFDGENAAQEKEIWVMDEYKKNLKEQINVILKNDGIKAEEINLNVEEDSESSDYGKIRSISLQVTQLEAKDADESSGITSVEPVTIGNTDANRTAAETVSSDEIISLKRKLSENYEIDMNQILVKNWGGDGS